LRHAPLRQSASSLTGYAMAACTLGLLYVAGAILGVHLAAAN
jgi:hypothetical protein